MFSLHFSPRMVYIFKLENKYPQLNDNPIPICMHNQKIFGRIYKMYNCVELFIIYYVF